jgi:hypothetical protein
MFTLGHCGSNVVPMIYTCPMHPQIERDHPGNCPICGMALELKSPGAGGEEENAELRDMTRRFWIGLVLTIPVLGLVMAFRFAKNKTAMALTLAAGIVIPILLLYLGEGAKKHLKSPGAPPAAQHP